MLNGNVGPESSVAEKAQSNHSASGFTLIELMVAISVLVLIAVLASTNLLNTDSWFAHNRLKAATRQLALVFQTAKMEAIKRNVLCTVTFNQTIDGGEHYDCIAYVDADEDLEYDFNGDGTYNNPGDELILKRFNFADYPGVSLDTTQGGGDGLTFGKNDDGNPSLAFTSRGLTRSNSGGFGAGTAYLINDYGSTFKVIVSSAGRIRIE